MSVATYTKSGAKSATPAKLDKKVFGVEIDNHDLLHRSYLSYLAGGRSNIAKTKKRGEVRGGGKKPWRQKGTGRARFGSSRNPIWRGGGIAFGPTGNENYQLKLNSRSRQVALRQALSLAAKEDRIKVVESINFSEGKVKPVVALLAKLDASKGRTVIVVDSKDSHANQATGNLASVKLTTAEYLNVFETLNADQLIFTKPALEKINQRLGEGK